jgi:hypothetical protein
MPLTEKHQALRDALVRAAPEIDPATVVAVETGWQAWVAVGTEHVYKHAKSVEEITATILKDRGGSADAATWATAIHAGFERGNARIQSSSVPPELIGRPRFSGHSGYLQTRMMLLREIIASLMAADKKGEAFAAVETAVAAVPKLWSHGIHDLSGKFSCNMAFAPDRQVALIDYGELASNRRDVADYIATKRWETNYSIGRDFPLPVRECYFEACNTLLTLDTLDQQWRDL